MVQSELDNYLAYTQAEIFTISVGSSIWYCLSRTNFCVVKFGFARVIPQCKPFDSWASLTTLLHYLIVKSSPGLPGLDRARLYSTGVRKEHSHFQDNRSCLFYSRMKTSTWHLVRHRKSAISSRRKSISSWWSLLVPIMGRKNKS